MKRRNKTIRLVNGTEDGYRWDLTFRVPGNQHNWCWSGSFYLAGKKRKDKHKKIALITSTELGYEWELYLHVSAQQREYGGDFYLADELRENTSRTIILAAGGVDYWGWQLVINISAKQYVWQGSFHLADELRRYRAQRRAEDRHWAERTFPRRWKQQFEVHHDWLGGEVCYFLTPEEHRKQDKILRYANP